MVVQLSKLKGGAIGVQEQKSYSRAQQAVAAWMASQQEACDSAGRGGSAKWSSPRAMTRHDTLKSWRCNAARSGTAAWPC